MTISGGIMYSGMNKGQLPQHGAPSQSLIEFIRDYVEIYSDLYPVYAAALGYLSDPSIPASAYDGDGDLEIN